MSLAAIEQPHVLLTVNEEVPAHLRQRVLDNTESAIASGMMQLRDLVIGHVRAEIASTPVVDAATVRMLYQAAFELALPRYTRVVMPYVARAYLEGYMAARAGNVPTAVLNALAEDYTREMGMYFHKTSAEAVQQGFTSFVNRKLPARVAAERVMGAYGLTPRQMNGVVSGKFDAPVESSIVRRVDRRIREYIGTALRQRLKIFAEQETHNLSLQAQQAAWLWRVQQGDLDPLAKKVWITARDERVCSICGPLHNKRVKVTEQFRTPNGRIWVPGVHVNCRCQVSLLEVTSAISKADSWYNDEYIRSSDGRFATKRTVVAKPKIGVKERTKPGALEQFLAQPVVEEQKTEKLKSVTPPSKLSSGKLNGQKLASGKLTSTPQKLGTTTEKLTATSTKLTVEQARLSSTAKDKIKASTDRLVSRGISRMAPPREMPEMAYRPTVKLPAPAYAVVPRWAIDADGRIDLEDITEFYSDSDSVAFEANEAFHQQIDDAYEQIAYTGMDIMHMQTSDGRSYSAQIDAEDLYDVVATVAYANSADPDWKGENAKLTVTWLDELTGEPQWSEQMTYGQAADRIGLEPEEFEVVVLQLSEGHDSSLGRTTMEPEGTYRGGELWTTSGRYVTEESHKEQVGHSAPITFMNLYPDVETQIIKPF